MVEEKVPCKDINRTKKLASILILFFVILYCFPQIRENMLDTLQRFIKYIWGEKNTRRKGYDYKF